MINDLRHTQLRGVGGPTEAIAELERHLTIISSDRALQALFRAQHPNLVALFRDLVDAEEKPLKFFGSLPQDFACMQVSIFDNWPRGRRPAKFTPYSRYGVEVRVWKEAPTTKTEWSKPSWDGECRHLWEGKREARAKAKRLTARKLKAPIDPQAVEEISARAEEADAVGFLQHKFQRSHTEFFPGHYALLSLNGGDPVLVLETPNCVFGFSGFTSLTAARNPVKAANPNCIGQVRYARDPALSIDARHGWAAGECEVVLKPEADTVASTTGD